MLCILLTGVLVASAAIPSLYRELVEAQKQNLLSEARQRAASVEQYLHGARQVAVQITSRSRAREKLEAFNRGEIEQAELESFSEPILLDAMSGAERLLGVRRLALSGEAVVEVGWGIPNTFKLSPDEIFVPTIAGVAEVFGTQVLGVAAPIEDRDGARVGTDVVMFDASPLLSIVVGRGGLGDKARIVLARRQGESVEPIGWSGFGASSFDFSPLSLPGISHALNTAIEGEFGVSSFDDAGESGDVIAYARIHGAPWGLAVAESADRITAVVRERLLPVGGLIVVIVLFGATMTGLLVQPLTRRVSQYADALAKTNAEIEERVERRTRELSEANDALQSEVSARKRIEKELVEAKESAEAATRAKSAFLAAMSHEIRTPMNGVVGMVDLLRRTELDREQQDMIETVRGSARSLRQIIDDILDFSKVEAGRIELESMPFPLDELVESVVDAFAPIAEEKRLVLTAYVDPSLPALIEGDQGRIRQILWNLIGNAVKFTESQGNKQGVVRVRAERAGGPEDDGVVVRYRVTDNGIGMDPDARGRIFNAFEQADRSTTRRFGGTGLGLAICKRLVGLMAGAIEVDSEPGAGSTFSVTIRHPVAADSATQAASSEIRFGGDRILVVEPEATVRDVLADFLREAGADVAARADGDGAIAVLEKAASGGRPFRVCVFGPGASGARGRSVPDRFDSATAGPGLRFVTMKNGPGNRRPRVAGGHTVAVGASAVVRSRLLEAVAIAAGRASPDGATNGHRTSGQREPVPGRRREKGREERILVAEDNPVNQMVIRRQLEELGYTCDIAGDGALALEALGQKPYALLLTDVHMPEMDGYTLTARIRDAEVKDGSPHRLPIIAITANVLTGETERCLAAGMDDFLPKPMELSELDDTLREWLPESPACVPADSPALVDVFAEAASEPEKGPVLVIEEVREHQHAIAGQLAGLGYASDVVDSAKAGLAAMRSRRYLAVLTDVHMQGMDGLELVATVRGKGNGARRVPVIGMSANTLQGERERCLRAGMCDVLEKPVQLEMLRRVLEAMLAAPKDRADESEEPRDAELPGPAGVGGGPNEEGGAPIDEGALEEICSGDEEARAQILESFLEDARVNADRIVAAWDARDAAAVGNAAHGLKSSSRTVGAHELADICEELEWAGKSGELEGLAAKARSLPGLVSQIERFLK